MRPLTLALAGFLIAQGAAQGAAQAASIADPKATAVAPEKPTRELPSPYTPGYAGGATPPATGQAPDFAYGAYQRGQYVTAFREATKRIEADPKDASAMTLLGELYNQGLGVAQNPVKAADWYKLAAKQNDPAAMSSLGLMALDGRGVPRDPKAGRRWLEQAAALGSPTASYNLGLILIATGAPADEAEAAKQFRKAAEAELGRRNTIWACSTFRGGACRRIRPRRRNGSAARRTMAISRARSSTRSCCSTGPA